MSLKVKCPVCGEKAEVIPLRNEFSYSGTHCTGGRDGIHYPSDWGMPVTECCEEPIDVAIECEDYNE